MSSQEILQELCRELDLPVQEFTPDNPLVLNFDDTTEITFIPDGQSLSLAARLSPCDLHDRAALVSILRDNDRMLKSGSGCDCLVLDTDASHVILLRRNQVVDSVQALSAVTERFLETLKQCSIKAQQALPEEPGESAETFNPYGFSGMIPV